MIATIAFALIAAAAAVQAVLLLRGRREADPATPWALAAAAALLVAVIVDRSVRIQFVAVTNTYESLVFFAGALAAVAAVLALVLRRRLGEFVLFGATMVALVLLALSSSPLAPRDIQPPIPALRSLWLVLHVTLAFVGEAFFTVSFVAAIVALAARDEERRARADRLVASTIGIGYPIFTAGALIFGAVWAESAWGRYWGWDPKETWALITWLVYTAYLHTRLVRKLRGRTSAILAIVGFVATIFTFFGVNFLLPGLHSYG